MPPVSSNALQLFATAAMFAAMEAGLVTLIKIIGTLVLAMGIIPIIFLFSPGDKAEPEPFGASHDHH